MVPRRMHAAQRLPDVPFEIFADTTVFETEFTLSEADLREYEDLLGLPPGHHDAGAPAWALCTFEPLYSALGGRVAQGTIHARRSVSINALVPINVPLAVRVDADVAESDERRRVILRTRFVHGATSVAETIDTFLWGATAS